MSPKRHDRVAPPPEPGGWEFRFLTSDAEHRTIWLSHAGTGHPKATE